MILGMLRAPSCLIVMWVVLDKCQFEAWLTVSATTLWISDKRDICFPQSGFMLSEKFCCGRIGFVCLYWNGQIITEHMSESLIPRVSLNQDGLKRGDMTLKIRNVSLQDEGRYSCFIPGKNFRETVQLVVGEFALQVLPHMKNICPEHLQHFSISSPSENGLDVCSNLFAIR
uniref:Ig-like domain-containing protein n=1 Tax=Oryzias latipes TaxID=8090 RepID=A0A3P9ICN9_ORYLA